MINNRKDGLQGIGIDLYGMSSAGSMVVPRIEFYTLNDLRFRIKTMSLVPCRECGVLNSSEAEICLSCEFPIKGRQKTNGLRWIALLLVALLGVPFAVLSAQMILTHLQLQPERPK
jgi:uncharacterized paraquat-inducible protein A